MLSCISSALSFPLSVFFWVGVGVGVGGSIDRFDHKS